MFIRKKIYARLISEPIPCPTDYPFIINDNKTCCKYFRRKFDPNLGPPFDGSLLEISDPPDLCFGDQFAECANVPLGSTCFANPDGDGRLYIIKYLKT